MLGKGVAAKHRGSCVYDAFSLRNGFVRLYVQLREYSVYHTTNSAAGVYRPSKCTHIHQTHTHTTGV